MENFVIGNMVWNGALVGSIVYLVRKWMNGIEATAEKNRQELAASTAITSEELKVAIRENRDEYRESSDKIINIINKLAEHVAISNGRTSKLENRIEVQVALCQERNRRDACHSTAEDN